MRHLLQVATTAVFLTAVTWNWLEWKGLVSFAPMWIAFEVIYRLRARGLLACPHCGFDPYLQLTDARKAREEIEAHWRRKFAEKGIPYPEMDGKQPHLVLMEAIAERQEGRRSDQNSELTPSGSARVARESFESENSSSLSQ